MAAPNLVNVTSIFGKTVAAALDTTTTTDILTCSADKVLKINFYDACATLSAFTAYAIINDLKKIENQKIIISGGGTKNKFILNLIKENLGNRVISIDEIYGDAKFIESQAFAYLGIRRIKNLPISLPGTTGVKSPITGGKIT